ncbi:MAG: glycosyltransferase [Deinococcales bacterium]|nr:glycosyltransferase [Chitinophagaceae bacterium]
MQRICTSLVTAGYDVLLVGRLLKKSIPLQAQPFTQKRLYCVFSKKFLFYAEYNIRLFIYLLFTKIDAFCAIDLDTILPCYFASAIKNKPRVYDAHELFTELKEVISRKSVHKFWLLVEQFAVPKYKNGYTVNCFIQEEFKRRYGVNYQMVRNLPFKKKLLQQQKFTEPTIIYQGAVNEGRSFESLIPAMQNVNAKLLICGNGNFYNQTQALVHKYNLSDKVELKGYLLPSDLQTITQRCHIGITIFEEEGLNQYYSLANRFFDYMMAGLPQVCVDYPEYKLINNEYKFAYLINNVSEQTIATALNKLLADNVLYSQLQANCNSTRDILNWQEEEKILINFWKGILQTN